MDQGFTGSSSSLDREKEVLMEKYRKYVSSSQAFKYFPLIVNRAENARVWDISGKCYIDFLSSAATYNIGHSNPVVINALKQQLDHYIHYCLYLYHRPVIELAELLVNMTPGVFSKKVAFGLSGGDACDTALKASLVYTKKPMIISYTYSYHGTTALGIAVGGSFSHDLRDSMGFKNVYFIDYPDTYRCKFGTEDPDLCGDYYLSELEDVLRKLNAKEKVAALIIEPIQGDGGVLVPPKNYMKGVKKLTAEHGIVLIDDEIQAGMGRTGKMFAIEHFNVEPDIITMAKALGGGMPISVAVGRAEIMDSAPPQSFFATSAAHALSCIAAIKTIQFTIENKLLDRARELGEYLANRLRELGEEHELIGDVRGLGLMIGVDIVKDKKSKTPDRNSALKIIWRSWEKGLIMMTYGKYGNVLRIAPPLTIPKEDLEKALEIIEESINDVERGKVPDEVIAYMTAWKTE